MRYVIIGGGIAGVTAAGELRKLCVDDEIVLVSEEQHPLYSRVLLPHFLKGKVPRERVFLKKESWYAEQNIEWLRGVRVESIDSTNKHVSLSDGRELPYDKLLIATGGDLRTVDGDPRGVSYFRTLDDADHVDQLIRERSDHKAVVYGGGFIACEYINLFAHHGIPTDVILRGPHFWSRIFDEETGALVNQHLETNGITLYPEQTIESVEGERELTGVKTSSGQVEATILGIGIGIEPDFSILHEAGIETGVSIKTNEYLETSVENIYAAGDVAEFYDVITKRHLYVGNWMNAMSQGRTVAKTMAGERIVFELVSSYATNVLGLEMIFVGDTSRTGADEIQVHGSAAEGGVTQVFVRDGKVVGATIVGRNSDRKPITEAIKGQSLVDKLSL